MSDSRATLQDVYAVVNRLEDKLDTRLNDLERDVDDLKLLKGRLLGIGSVLVLLSSIVVDFAKRKILGE